MIIRRMAILSAALGMVAASPARADWRTKAAQELAELFAGRGAKAAAVGGSKVLAGRIAGAAARHGDDVFAALRRVGPKALTYADDAGAGGARAMRLLAKHGDDAATFVLARPKGMALLGRYGDDAAELLIKHKGAAEPILEQLGQPAMGALRAVGSRNGRRMAMMLDAGELTASHAPEVLPIIQKYGDPAVDFLWRNKGTLAATACMASFVAHPEPFINGTRDITKIAAENTVRPLASAVGDTARGIGQSVAWLVAAGGVVWLFKTGLRKR